MNGFRYKKPAEQRDIFRPKLFYNYINLRLKNSQCTIKTQRSSKKKTLNNLSPFSRKHISYYFCDSWPLCVFSALCNLPRKAEICNKFFEKNFEKQFSLFSIFEVFCKGTDSPSLEGDFFVTFDHMEQTRFLIECGNYLDSVLSAPCVFSKLLLGQRVPPRFHS